MNKDVTEFEPAGAGGAIVSTPADLNRFWPAVNWLLPRWALAEMRTTKPATGLGIARVALSCGVTVWAHMGGLANGGVANACSTSSTPPFAPNPLD